MKKKEFEAIGNRLLPDLPGFAVKGPLLLLKPADSLLRGIYFARSIDPRAFYVEVFVQPLFVRSQFIGFNFGKRLGGGCHSWNADAPNLIPELSAGLKRDALPFLSRVESLLDFVDVARSFPLGNPHTREAIAFALARAGKGNEAVEVIDELLSQIDLKVAWQRDMAVQAKTLRDKLVANPTEAQYQLEVWEAESAKNLGLEEFR